MSTRVVRDIFDDVIEVECDDSNVGIVFRPGSEEDAEGLAMVLTPKKSRKLRRHLERAERQALAYAITYGEGDA